jgi:hypothetical protein
MRYALVTSFCVILVLAPAGAQADGQGTSPEPFTAEISFKYETESGRVSEAMARRALKLFQAMQEGLGDWLTLERATKTSLALPPCQ